MQPSLDKEFQDRVAIVTGAASGIGAAVARLLGARGAAVVVADHDLDGAEKVADAISRNAGQAAAPQTR